MRSSEYMAYALYLADWNATHVSPPDPDEALAWEQLAEEQQLTYLRHASAMLTYLFEHGRIITYIPTPQRYQELSDQHQEHLAAKIREALTVSPSDQGEMTEQQR
jgi:hypothetical protein